MGRILMKMGGTKQKPSTERDIGKIARSCDDIRKYILLIHAFGGCDTTSAIFGQDKTSIMTLLRRNKLARNAAETLVKSGASISEVGEAGIKLFVLLYNGKDTDTLSKLRCVKYKSMVSSSLVIKPERLLPTGRAAWFHITCLFTN